MLSLFGSTYICEKTINHGIKKYKLRSKLTGKHLLRIYSSDSKPRFINIIKRKQQLGKSDT